VSPLNTLWQPVPVKGPDFAPVNEEHLPELTRKYLHHSIADGIPLARAVRLQMSGEIKIKGWIPFTATQVVRADVGFVWSARAQKGITFITGSDEFLDGEGEMKWKLFGLIPVMTGSGPDITRSAGDRFAIERILLPSSLAGAETKWNKDAGNITATTTGISPITLNVRPSGQVRTVAMQRWGNPNGAAFGMTPFGGYVDEEATWDGYTIPSRLRIGWYFGSDRFAVDGEFFRATITHAEFR